MVTTHKNWVLLNAGIYVYAFAAIALGVINLVCGDFATIWQPIQAFGDHVPGRYLLAYVTAVALLLGGTAVVWYRTARLGALIVCAVDCLFAIFWLPRVIHFPQIFGTWGGLLEALFPVTAAALVYASLGTSPSAWAARTAEGARYLFGLCVLSFGISHFSAFPQTAAMVPAWVPPGQPFWAAVTGVAHLLAAMAVLTGVADLLATRLLTLMLILFGLLVWMPQVFTHPHDRTVWAGNAVNLAMIGTAWIFADWMRMRKEARKQPDRNVVVNASPLSA